jgi:hypothetical protein
MSETDERRHGSSNCSQQSNHHAPGHRASCAASRVQLTCNIARENAVMNGQQGSYERSLTRDPKLTFSLVKALRTCPVLVVRGGVELPTFRFSGWQMRRLTMQSLPLRAETEPLSPQLSTLKHQDRNV